MGTIIVPPDVRRLGEARIGSRGSAKTLSCAHQRVQDLLAEPPMPTVAIDPKGEFTDFTLTHLREAIRRSGRTSFWDRVVIVPVGGYRDPVDGSLWIVRTPMLEPAGDEEPQTVAARFTSLCAAIDPTLLGGAAVQGLNAIARVSTLLLPLVQRMNPPGQITEAVALLERPERWQGKIAAALKADPQGLAEAADFFTRVYPKLRETERHNLTSSFLAKALPIATNKRLRAQFAGDAWDVPLARLGRDVQLLIFDCRAVPKDFRRAAATFLFRAVAEWVRRRGSTRGMPVNFVVDELDWLIEPGNEVMEAELSEIIAQLGRSHGCAVALTLQSVTQASLRVQKLLRFLGLQLYASEADEDGARQLAKTFDLFDPHRVKDSYMMYAPDSLGSEYDQERQIFYTADEQQILNARKYRHLPPMHFHCAIAAREGEAAKLRGVVDFSFLKAGPWPDAKTEEAKRRLIRRHGHPLADVLAEIAARQPREQPIQEPASIALPKRSSRPRWESASEDVTARFAPS